MARDEYRPGQWQDAEGRWHSEMDNIDSPSPRRSIEKVQRCAEGLRPRVVFNYAPRRRWNPDLQFWLGVLCGVPLTVGLWAVVVFAVKSLHG